jgi:hypothetical protein
METKSTITSRRRIAVALEAGGMETDNAEQIAFHLADCEEDFKQIAELFQDNLSFNDQEIEKLVFRFLAHVPNHLAAAQKLSGFGPIEDIFGVGVLEEDKD